MNVDDKAAKNFNIVVTSMNVLRNYFDVQTKLFLDLYLIKFLATSFPRMHHANGNCNLAAVGLV